MNNIIDTQSGERLSFFKLFNERKYRVLIPIIQRDYAQGRKSSKEVRNTFLNALYKYLEEDIPNRDLDFVYGSLNKVDGITDFIPLDGQQRLTTLFLLHWYLFQISSNTEKKNLFKSALLNGEKSMFTYETRGSSEDFCDALVCKEIDFNNLIDNSLSKTIENASWYFLSWKNDPTIQSMLTMLNAIHEKFADRPEFFERLLDNENPIITFLFLNLKDFELTDDLYIKMNSRGKPLTPFENFKAKFEQFLESIIPEREFTLKYDKSTEEKVSLKEYFSYNIDTKWANLFWNYRTLQNRSSSESDETFDDELMNFIRVIFTNQYAIKTDATQKDKDDSLEYLLGTNVAKKNKDYSDIISFNKYEELNALSEESVIYLIDALNNFSNGNNNIHLHLPEEYKFYFDEKKSFENVLKHDFDSNQERICFHAYIRFLITHKTDRAGLTQWMRVIHNLTQPENTVIDNANEVSAAIRSIEELLPYSNDILEYLKSSPEIALFSSWQVLEEKIKAQLIKKHDNWKNKIEAIEKHGYFNGQIGFILEFSGILEYYTTHENCDWDETIDAMYFEKFSDYSEKASLVFEESYDNRKHNKNFVFERAVLTKGNYFTNASQNRKNLLSTNLVKNNIKRDHSWKRLLRISGDEEWKSKRLFVQQVFDDSRFDKKDLVNSLESICCDKTNSWRDYFISYPYLIGYCNQGFIRFGNEKDIRLYGESQSNHTHVEMYTYQLWKEYFIQNKESFTPFKKIYYYDIKSIDDDACIALEGFCHSKIYYGAYIYHCNIDNLPNPYEIKFAKSKGDNIPEKYSDNIKNILNQLDFEWNDEYGGYFFTSLDSNSIIEKIEQLNKELKGL
ncbi:MAG: DUF262 domain-containing protein [Flavobacteriaceae bacterium]